MSLQQGAQTLPKEEKMAASVFSEPGGKSHMETQAAEKQSVYIAQTEMQSFSSWLEKREGTQ